MSAPFEPGLHPKYGKHAEVYRYDRLDGFECAQTKYRNGTASPKHVAWWIRGTDGEWYISHGDIKLAELKPYNWAALVNPHAAGLVRVLCEGPKDANAAIDLGFIASDHKALTSEHAEYYRDQDVIVVRDKDAQETAITGGGYSNHKTGKTPGVRHADRAVRILSGVAKRIAVVEMPGDGIKDLAQWSATHPGSRAEKARVLGEMFENALAGAGKPVVVPGGITLEALLRKDFPPLVEIVPGLIVPGLTLLQGKPKAGKSLLAIEIILAVAGGGHALGAFECMRVPVLALMLEDPERRLKDRVSAILRYSSHERGDVTWHDMGLLRQLSDMDMDLLTFLDAKVAETGARLVVIDVFEKVRSLIPVPEKASGGRAYAEDYVVAARLQQFAQERDVAVLLLHHDRKAEGDLIDRVSGTLGVAGAADHIAGLSRKEAAKPRKSKLGASQTIDGLGGHDGFGGTQHEQLAACGWQLEIRGRDLMPATWGVALDGPRWKLSDGGGMEDPDKVRARAMRNEGCSFGAIAETLGRPKSTIQRWCD